MVPAGLLVLGVLVALRLRDPARIGGTADAVLFVAVLAYVGWLHRQGAES